MNRHDSSTVYAIDGVTPVVDPTAFVHPSRRADRRRDRRPGLLRRPVRVPARRLRPTRGARRRERAGQLRHARLSRAPARSSRRTATSATARCCTAASVQRNALVGMNAVVNDNAVDRRVGDRRGDGVRQGRHGRAAAHARRRRPRARSCARSPSRSSRGRSRARSSYQELTRRSLATMRATAPLAVAEPDRPRIDVGELLPLSVLKASGRERRGSRRRCRARERRTRSAVERRAPRSCPRRPPTRSSSRRPALDTIPNTPLGDMIRFGRDVFVDTQRYAKKYVGNTLNCVNCHLDAGRQANSAPLWAAYVAYPAFRTKNEQVNTLRAAPRRLLPLFDERPHAAAGQRSSITALVSYSYWLATGAPVGAQLAGRGFPAGSRRRRCRRARARGEAVYATHCAACHQANGQGLKTFPPVWGRSRTTRRGHAQVHTAALHQGQHAAGAAER